MSPDPIAFRFATWNVDQFSSSEARWSLLAEARADVIALQEVVGRDVAAHTARHAGPTLFSQDVYGPATRRWIGCGLMFPEGTEVLDAGVVEALPKPQRCLWARVRLSGREITSVSWHAPNAAGDGRSAKMEAYEAMSRWLRSQSGTVILGADLNTWEDPVDLVDADPADNPFFEQHRFFDPGPEHGLTDAYRQALIAHSELDSLRASAGEGPLAVSHVLKSGAKHRFDRVLVSNEVEVVSGEYWYESSLAAGSDHALHWVDLKVGG